MSDRDYMTKYNRCKAKIKSSYNGLEEEWTQWPLHPSLSLSFSVSVCLYIPSYLHTSISDILSRRHLTGGRLFAVFIWPTTSRIPKIQIIRQIQSQTIYPTPIPNGFVGTNGQTHSGIAYNHTQSHKQVLHTVLWTRMFSFFSTG